MKHQREHTTNNQKDPYISPELKVYGTISELTHSGTLNVGDAFGGSALLFNEVPPEK